MQNQARVRLTLPKTAGLAHEKGNTRGGCTEQCIARDQARMRDDSLLGTQAGKLIDRLTLQLTAGCGHSTTDACERLFVFSFFWRPDRRLGGRVAGKGK
jgi:hypothetical protein